MENRNLFLSRLFSTGPPVVIAFDHGMFDGPIEGAEKVAEIPAKIPKYYLGSRLAVILKL